MPETASQGDLSFASDTDLIRLANAGVQNAFGELVNRHCGAVRTHLRRMGLTDAEADHITRNTFGIAYEHLGDYRFQGPFQGWLKRIASRRYLRKMRRTKSFALNEEQSVADLRVAQGETCSFEAVLGGLSRVERLCLTLHFSADMTPQTIAEELAVSSEAVQNHIQRGIDRLKAGLNASAEAGGKA